jgi:hypothetical protein
MFIPTQTPDLQQPLTQLLETKPVQPVTAVPGITEDAQHLDSRVALQWAQPVLQPEKGQSARTALAVPLAVQIVKPLVINGFEPQGPDPDALCKGQVHPMLSQGLASWINAVGSKPVSSFQANPALLQNSVSQSTADVMPVLLNLYKALTQSDIFAAQRLAESWLPRPVKAHEYAQAGERTDTANPRPTKANTSSLHLDENQQAFKDLAQPASEPSMAQLAKWVNALEPDGEPAQQAAQMLTHGQMVWLADLAPGVPMRMVREDAWRNDAQRPAQLEKGAMLRVELNLPNLGRIRVVGSQWGQEVSLQIAHDASSQDQWFAMAPDLLEELQAKGIGDVRVEALPNQDEVDNG